jgi:two-component system nitrogen regulation response regulator NtrX
MSEKQYLEYKIRENDHNLAKTAREIDLPRSNLYKKLESLGITLPGGTPLPEGDGELPE